MKFKVGDYVKNIGYATDTYDYGLITGINIAYDSRDTWITVLILCTNQEIVYASFREYELEFLSDKISDKIINKFNKLMVFG